MKYVLTVVMLAAGVLVGPDARISPAQARDMSNCNQTKNLDLAIKGCSRYLRRKGISRRNRKIARQRLGAAYINRGVAAAAKGKYKAAIADYDEAIKLLPKSSIAYTNRGISRLNAKGSTGDAISDLQKAIKLDPKNYKARAIIGLALIREKKYAEAVTEVSRTIKLMTGERDRKKSSAGIKATLAEAYYYRGLAHWNLSNLDAAVADFEQALKVDPKHADANKGLRSIRDGKSAIGGILKEQIPDIAKSIKKNSKDFWSWVQTGETHKKKGEHDEAVAAFRKGLELAPNEDARKQSMTHLVGGLYVRGYRHLEKGKYDLAIADFSEVIKLKPDHFWAWRDRGKARLNLGHNDQAIADETEAIKINPKSAEAYEFRAVSHFENGDYERAIEDITQTISLKPKKDAWAHAVRAISLLRAGRASDGLPDIELALKLKPKNANFLETHGHILEELGRKDEALAAYRKALEINPKAKPSQEGIERLKAASP